AWLLLGFAQGGIRGHHIAWKEAAERALDHYTRAGWPGATCIGQVAAALYYGPTPAADAVASCERLLEDPRAGQTGEAHVRVFLGGLDAMRGRFEEARRHIARGVTIYEELGHLGAATVFGGAVTGDVELLAGDFAAAEEALAEACSVLQRTGNHHDLATRAADLAAALYGQGRYDDAGEWIATAAASSAADNLSAQPVWRSVKAKLVARHGDFSAAEALGREAVRQAEETEALNRR